MVKHKIDGALNQNIKILKIIKLEQKKKKMQN